MFNISKSTLRQSLAAICCCISSMTVGSIAGWSASAFPKLRNNQLDFRLSLFQEAWVINFYYIGSMTGPFPAGLMMDAIGRKSTLLLASILCITNWTLVSFACNEYMLYLARFCSGLWAGFVFTIVPAFLAEALQPRVRGRLGSILYVMYFSGNLYEYIIGPYVTYRTFGMASCVPALVFATTFLFIPETPYYYMMRGQRKKAEKSLSWLRGDTDVSQELDNIEDYVQTFLKTRGTFKDLFLNKIYRKALVNVQAVYFVQKLCGLFTILAYLTVIIPPRVGPLTSENCTIIIGIVTWLSTIVASSLMDLTGRKTLFVISNIGIFVTMTITGVWYFLSSQTGMNLATTTFIPFLSILFCGIFFCLGVGPVAALYQGELLPSNIKARACTVTTICSSFSSVLNTTLFAVCIRYIGLYINFFLFALISAFGLYYARYHFIETKGKTLQEIQEELMGIQGEKFTNKTKSPVNAKPAIFTVPMPNEMQIDKTTNSFEKDAKWTDE